MTRESDLRKLIAEVFRWTYLKGLNHVIGGNVSARLNEETILITPTRMPKHLVRPSSIVKMRLDGTVIGSGRPSSEWRMHVSVYSVRDDVKAIVHTHQPYTLALHAAGFKVDLSIAEAQAYLGTSVAEIPYYTPGSQELADAVARALKVRGVNVVILKNHGVVAVGSNLFEALNRAEVLENVAMITVLSNLLK